MDREFGFDFELTRECRERLHETARENTVAGEHVRNGVTKEEADQGIEHLIALSVAGAVSGVVLVVNAAAQNVIKVFTYQQVDHFGCGGRIVGVVTVDHHVNIGIDVCECATHNIALTLAGFGANDCAGRGCNFSGAVRRIVIVNVDFNSGNCILQVRYNCADCGFFVVARDDCCDTHLEFLYFDIEGHRQSLHSCV